MAVTAKWYYAAIEKLLDKEVDFVADTVKVALLDNGHTPSQSTHDYFDDVSADELANGNGYTSGGEALANKSITTGASWDIDADDTQWASASFTARYAVVYVDTGVEATSPLLLYVDFGEDKTASGGNFDITWHADGIGGGTVS